MAKVGNMGERMLEVARIVKYIKTLTLENPQSIRDIYNVLKHEVNNEQQVASTVSYYHKKGEISRIREGAAYKYWGTPIEGKLSPAGLAKLAPAGTIDLPVAAKRNIPEVRVEQDRIVIEHAKCRVIVEFNN